jgi:hypothetical protein
MILLDQLIHKSRQRLNRLATNEHQEIQETDMILIINEAQIKLVKQKKKAGEKDSKHIADIQFLIEKPEDHKLNLSVSNTQTNRWKAVTGSIKPSYMYYVDGYILADKDSCKDRVVWINPDLVQHGSINVLLNNSNYKPSFEYQETFCDETNGEIGIYTDGTFTPTALYLSYIRYPKFVSTGDVELFDNTPAKQDSEFPEHLEDELLDVIVQDIAQYTENPSAYKASLLSRENNK